MKKRYFLFLGIIIIVILYLSCSDTPYPDSYYDVEIYDWDQDNVVGNTGEEVTCDIDVENHSIYYIYGYVEVEAIAFDGTRYSEKLEFDLIEGSGTFGDYVEFSTGGKRVIDVKISDEQFYYR